MFIQCDHGIVVEPRQQAYNNKMPEGWVHGKTRNSGEVTLERNFKPGEVVLLTMTSTLAADDAVIFSSST